ncbi:MAG: ROK family protein [Chloroflexi bacterium]|nr:ROK family protein [Chloroflexota bacterium]
MATDPLTVLALDLGGTRIRTAVVTPAGQILSRSERRTPGADGPDAVIRACVEELRTAADRVDPATRRSIAGLGLASPGPLDPRSGILIEPPNFGPGFIDVPFRDPIAQAMGLPAALERDTNVAALAEMTFGAARGVRNFLYLTISTGVGGSVVIDGRIYGGPDRVAGELGHIPVVLDGPVCGCGGVGHVEAIASGAGMAKIAAEAVARGNAPALAARARAIAPRPLEALDIAEVAEAGDAVASGIIETGRRAVAQLLVGLVNTFNPEAIVLGGAIAQAQGERLLGPARAAVEAWAFRIPRTRVRIAPAELGDDVGLLGAVPLVALRG